MNALKIFCLLLVTLPMTTGCKTDSKKQKPGQPETSSHSLTSNDIELSKAWVRPAAKGTNSAAYLKIYNGTGASDTLAAVTANIAGKAEVHESFEKDGMAGMRPAGKLAIQPDSSLVLRPGGLHVMLMQLDHELAKGDSVTLTLNFSRGRDHTITASVKNSF